MATQQQLTEARDALHQLIVGKKAVKIQKEGRMVEFTPTTRRDLEQYIKQLEIELGLGNRRRPIGVRL
ncbi:MAG: gpW family protein [Amphritea sp.]|nr:gpW family protein [Amphritea sp.]